MGDFMHRYTALLLAGGVGAALVASAVPASAAPDTVLVSRAGGGAQANDRSWGYAASGDGRYVLFESSGTNLVRGDTNGVADLFVHDRRAKRTTRGSVASGGAEANASSSDAVLSRDGRYVAFRSEASNLVPRDSNGQADVFLHDRSTGRTTRISVTPKGQIHGTVHSIAMSADGRSVTYTSDAPDVVPGDTNDTTDVFVYDRPTGKTSRVSVGTGGTQGDSYSTESALSADGRYVAFSSASSNLVPGDTNAQVDVFVHDRRTGTTRRASADDGGAQSEDSANEPVISANGRYVAFASSARLDPADTDEESDVFVRDLVTRRTELVSGEGGTFPVDQFSTPAISADGRRVAFHAGSPFLLHKASPGELIEYEAIYDRRTGQTTRVAQAVTGEPDASTWDTFFTADGRYAGFTSAASNLVPGDANEAPDAFLTPLR
jgi:Tol biopolymer transport system component